MSPVRRARLDRELVRRGLVGSREEAAAVIAAGRTFVDGVPATKPSTYIEGQAQVRITGPAGERWASRGGGKLHGAFQAFEAAGDSPDVRGRRCLDAGASTGGFTDVLLRAGAREVVAVDVGYGQLSWRLRTNPRVRVVERCNVRHLRPADIEGPTQVGVADLSFISLRLVLEALTACTAPDGELVVLVKPQFEVGRGQVGRGGVVRDPSAQADAVLAVCAEARRHGLGVHGLCASPLPGPAGNREFFAWLVRRGAGVGQGPDTRAGDVPGSGVLGGEDLAVAVRAVVGSPEAAGAVIAHRLPPPPPPPLERLAGSPTGRASGAAGPTDTSLPVGRPGGLR